MNAPAFSADAAELGILWPLLDPAQQEVYWSWRRSPARVYVMDCARRFGKSSIMIVSAHEDAITRPGARIPYAAQTQEEVREVLRPMTEGWLWPLLPASVRPRWQDGDLVFPNGSRIVIFGVDLHPDRGRGPALDMGYGDEVGFWSRPEYVIDSVLMPQALDRPWARLLLGSTPPRTPGHPWTTRYVQDAMRQGAYVRRTIHDNPRITPELVAEFARLAGGERTTTFRREYLAEHVVDETLAIVPEFSEHRDKVVEARERPAWFDAYVALDPGFAHASGLVFGYWDFEAACLVIEDDYAAPGKTSRELAEVIRAKEQALWKDTPRYVQGEGPKAQPYARYSDTDARLIADLRAEHDLAFLPTRKDNLQAQINSLRIHVAQHAIRIHPRCQTLISQLACGVWKKNRTQFDEVEGFGHFDALAALVYLDRMVARRRNPFPPQEYGFQAAESWIPRRGRAQGLEALMGGRR